MTLVRALTTDELDPAYDVIETAFCGAPDADNRALDLALVDPARALAVMKDERPVATAASFAFDLAVPGARLASAGVTWVSVLPTHRRRGLLTSLMTAQLAGLHERGEHLAVLWASQGAIYSRFGYGPATWALTLNMRAGAAFREPVDVSGLRLVTPTRELLEPIWQDASPVGSFTRSQGWWDYRLADAESMRRGQSVLRCVLDPDGYALYRTKSSWNDAGPDSSVAVGEVLARTPAATARLWRYLLDLDLVTTVRASLQPLDSPLLHLLAEPRAAQAQVGDNLWARLVSVPDALAGRRYDSPVDLVLDVRDTVCPWNAGRWRLSGDASGATCASSTDPADLALDVRELGAAYLGGTSLGARARAGLVDELSPGALAQASRAFGWQGPAPYGSMVF